MRKAKNEYERYRNLILEQKRLEERLERLLTERDDIQSRLTIDSVLTSDKEFPYTQHTATIEGYVDDSDKFSNRILNMELKRVRHMQSLNDAALSQTRQMIDDIEDEFIRSIVTYRFIDGLSWREVADRIGGGNTDNSVRKAYERYAKK